MIRFRVLIASIFVIMLSSCLDMMLGERHVKSIKYSQRDFESWYQVKGLFNHFPKKISNKSFIYMESRIPANMIESSYISYVYLFLDMEEDNQVFYPDTFMYKTHYKDLNFVVDYSFKYYQYYESQKVRNASELGDYPIPYFENYNFGLGEERIDFVTDAGFAWVFDKHTVPEDLEVFVLKAGQGDYWNVKCDLARPETMGDWKNGYSSGVAISREQNIAVYWMMAW